jgi:hypothetical protein
MKGILPWLVCWVCRAIRRDFCPALYRKSNLCIPRMKLHDLVPNSYIHVSMSDVYIPRISMPIWLQQIRQTDPENILNAHRYECVNWETKHYNSVLEVTRPNSFISGNT